MKYLWIILLIPVMALFSCNQGKVKKLEAENQQLMDANQEQDSLLNSFMASFNAFDQNLQEIKAKEDLIAMNAGDPEMRKETRKETILDDIQAINDLLDQNRNIIDELNQKLEASDGQVGQFRRMVANLKKSLNEKDTQIASLKENLVEMDFTIASLNRKVDTLSQASTNLAAINERQSNRLTTQSDSLEAQQARIRAQRAALNTAYYISGTAKELKQKNILSKEGAFLGFIGGTKTLSSDFDPKDFTPIDITEIYSIPVSTKKAELITDHPSGSYSFNEENNNVASLEIEDPERFWQTSKYLVVVTN